MTAIDINRKTTGVVLPAEVSSEIWSKTLEESAVMQLARRIALPGGGMQFQTITGEPTASWVGETELKPISKHTFGSKTMQGYTLAVIEPFSNQFRRDKGALYDELVRRLPYALSKKFDETVFGLATAPGANFDQLSSVTAVSLNSNLWNGLVAADAAISANDYTLDGWAFAPAAKAKLLTAVDTTGRPLFIPNMTGTNNVNELMGQRAYFKKGIYKAAASGSPEQLGFAGDWTQAIYGVVEDISISISDQATLKDGENEIHLWQQNMFAVRAEFEVGFRIKDEGAFVKLTGATA